MDDAAGQAPWDAALTAGLKHYQSRMGLRQTGILDETTLAALNIPASERAKELDASAHRLSILQNFPFDQRYVVVNIPAAAVEEVEGGRVVHRYAAVVGGTDHQSPQVQAKITDIIVNPTWTLPDLDHQERSHPENGEGPALSVAHEHQNARRARPRSEPARHRLVFQ